LPELVRGAEPVYRGSKGEPTIYLKVSQQRGYDRYTVVLEVDEDTTTAGIRSVLPIVHEWRRAVSRQNAYPWTKKEIILQLTAEFHSAGRSYKGATRNRPNSWAKLAHRLSDGVEYNISQGHPDRARETLRIFGVPEASIALVLAGKTAPEFPITREIVFARVLPSKRKRRAKVQNPEARR